MKKPLSGKKWFYAQGQSHKHKGLPFYLLKTSMNFYDLPLWARQALAEGYLHAMPKYLTKE